MTDELCSRHGVPELREVIAVLICALFAGTSAVRIGRTLGIAHVQMMRYADRLRACGVWGWGKSVPDEVQRAWFAEEAGDMALILDAMVATGEMARTDDGKYMLATRRTLLAA